MVGPTPCSTALPLNQSPNPTAASESSLYFYNGSFMLRVLSILLEMRTVVVIVAGGYAVENQPHQSNPCLTYRVLQAPVTKYQRQQAYTLKNESRPESPALNLSIRFHAVVFVQTIELSSRSGHGLCLQIKALLNTATCFTSVTNCLSPMRQPQQQRQ